MTSVARSVKRMVSSTGTTNVAGRPSAPACTTPASG